MWLESIQVVLKEIKSAISNKKEAKQNLFEAVESIEKAANDTTTYLKNCNRQSEIANTALSDIWMESAKKVRDIDGDLYMRLLAKAEYWSDPSQWNDQRVERVNIALDSIRKDSRNILTDK